MELCFSQIQHFYTSPAGESRAVLDIPDWRIQPGQQILVRGVSGSGKTTLFNIAAGLLRPSSGTVQIGGQAIYALTPRQRDRFRARHIGYIFQNHHLLPTLTALENVVMPMAFARQRPTREWRKRAADFLDRVGLSEHYAYRPARLSTGQRLRVAVARALVNEPPILLADEPTAALDSAAAGSVMDLLQQQARTSGALLIVASHDPALETRFSNCIDLQHSPPRLHATKGA